MFALLAKVWYAPSESLRFPERPRQLEWSWFTSKYTPQPTAVIPTVQANHRDRQSGGPRDAQDETISHLRSDSGSPPLATRYVITRYPTSRHRIFGSYFATFTLLVVVSCIYEGHVGYITAASSPTGRTGTVGTPLLVCILFTEGVVAATVHCNRCMACLHRRTGFKKGETT